MTATTSGGALPSSLPAASQQQARVDAEMGGNVVSASSSNAMEGRMEENLLAGPVASEDVEVQHLPTPRMRAPKPRQVQGIVVNCDGGRLVALCSDNSRASWNLSATMQGSAPIGGPPGPGFRGLAVGLPRGGARTTAVTSVGDRAIVVDSEGREALWDLSTGQCLYFLDDVGCGEAAGVTVSSPGMAMVVGRAGTGGVRIFDTQTGGCSHIFEPPSGEPLQGVAISADGQRVVAVDAGQKAVAYDLMAGRQLKTAADLEQQEVAGVASTSDGSRVLTVTKDGTARLWDVATRTCLYELQERKSWDGGMAIDADGVMAVTVTKDGVPAVWDLDQNLCVEQLSSRLDPEVKGVALTPDGMKAVAIARDGAAHVVSLPHVSPRQAGEPSSPLALLSAR